jgi:GNAT superfamily N-acetyltransferase
MRFDLSHVEAAAEVMGRAFWEYPFPAAFLPDEAERAEFYPHFWRLAIDLAIRHGESYATPNFEAVVNWESPGNALSEEQWVQSPHFDECMSNGGERPYPAAHQMEEMQKHNATMDHWYLQSIGVDPNQKGKGLASLLIQPMLERADAEALRVYLDTNTEDNISMYEHFGFRVVERADLPGYDYWNASMLREPR